MTCTEFTAGAWWDTVVSLEEFRALTHGDAMGIKLWRDAVRLMEHHKAASLMVAQQRVDSARARRDFPDYCEAVQTLRIVTAIWTYGVNENN